MKNPNNPKERNLVKGAIRRIFSRSELRSLALARNLINHKDSTRPRVSRWAFCESCGIIEAAYTMEVDHKEPVVPIDKPFESMNWDEFVDRLWCDIKGLQILCEECHNEKSKEENKKRKENKDARTKNGGSVPKNRARKK